MFRWIVLALFLLFWFSGVQYVPSGRVALQLRFGRLVKVKSSGLLLALPYPIDDVILVSSHQQEKEVEINEVFRGLDAGGDFSSIDPLQEGYCLTGDQNVVQAFIVAKYRIEEPVAYRLYTDQPEKVLHNVVVATTAKAVSGWLVDDVLRLQRGDDQRLPEIVLAAAQRRLDQLNCGMKISAIEFKQIHPPRHVIAEFRAVQSAEIARRTERQRADGFRAGKLADAQAQRDRMIKEAKAYRSEVVGRAQAEKEVFDKICTEYHRRPALVWQRVHLEALETVTESMGRLRFASPESVVYISDAEQKK